LKHIWIVVVGITLIAFGQLVEQVMAKIIHATLMVSHVGGDLSSVYNINLLGYNVLCALVIVIGVVAVVVERKRA